MTVGERIREMREARGISQNILADKIGAHYVSMSRWESGKANLDSISMLIKIAAVFNVPLTLLLNGVTFDGVVFSEQPASDDEKRKNIAAIKDGGLLHFWASVVETARDVANKDNPVDVDDAEIMLSRALSSLRAAREKTAARAALRQSVLPAPSAGESSEAVAV